MELEGLLIVLMTVTPVLVGLMIRGRIRHRALERRFWAVVEHYGLPPSIVHSDFPARFLDRPKAGTAQADSRMDQLESRFDQLADQLDRLAESQDFLARVMVDREGQLTDSAMRTPH